jgi:hypothetical protein
MIRVCATLCVAFKVFAKCLHHFALQPATGGGIVAPHDGLIECPSPQRAWSPG